MVPSPDLSGPLLVASTQRGVTSNVTSRVTNDVKPFGFKRFQILPSRRQGPSEQVAPASSVVTMERLAYLPPLDAFVKYGST